MDIFGLQLDIDSRKVKTAGKDLDGFTKKTGKAAKATDDLDKEVKGLNGTIKTATGVLGAYISLGFAKDIVMQADSYNILQQRIKTATSATGDYANISNQLYKISQSTGSSLESNVVLFQQLARSATEVGASNADVLKLTKTLQQLGRIGGSSAEQMSNAMLQFGQAMAGGVMRAEEFNSIVENTPEIAVRLAKGMGMTVGQLRMAVLEGNVLSKDVFASLIGQAEDINTEVAKMPESVQMAAVKLNNAWVKAVAGADSYLKITNKITKVLTAAADVFDHLNKKTHENDEAIKKTSESISQNLKHYKSIEQAMEIMKKQGIDNGVIWDMHVKQLEEAKAKNIELLTANVDLKNERDEDLGIVKNINKELKESKKIVEDIYAIYNTEDYRTEQNKEWIKTLRWYHNEYQKELDDEADEKERIRKEEEDALDRQLKDAEEQQKENHKNWVKRQEEKAEKLKEEQKILDNTIKITDTLSLTFDDLKSTTESWGDTLTDSLMEASETGKFTFKSLTDHIINDMKRMMIQALVVKPIMDSLYDSISFGKSGGSDLMGGLGNFFSGMFSGGNDMFASGGVVNRETSFMQSNGRKGTMGEAGSEAIMPLSRDSNGNLGVSLSGGSTGSNVVVNVINNANGTTATTSENTTNGQREIQIVIDAVKGEMGRGGFDKTMNSNYGIKRRGK